MARRLLSKAGVLYSAKDDGGPYRTLAPIRSELDVPPEDAIEAYKPKTPIYASATAAGVGEEARVAAQEHIKAAQAALTSAKSAFGRAAVAAGIPTGPAGSAAALGTIFLPGAYRLVVQPALKTGSQAAAVPHFNAAAEDLRAAMEKVRAAQAAVLTLPDIDPPKTTFATRDALYPEESNHPVVQEAYENEVERAYQKRLDSKAARPLERIVHRLDGRLETIIHMGGGSYEAKTSLPHVAESDVSERERARALRRAQNLKGMRNKEGRKNVLEAAIKADEEEFMHFQSQLDFVAAWLTGDIPREDAPTLDD